MEAYSFKSFQCVGDQVLRNGLPKISTNNQNTRVKLLPAPSRQVNGGSSKILEQRKKESVISKMNKLAKEKLSLGAKILQGGVEKAFKRTFNVNEGEELLKASQCSLFTTAGPITGRLFISNEKLAFCSDKYIVMYSSPSGEVIRYHYKVVIPLRNIKKAKQSENGKKPSKKYLQVVTNDDYEFWFMGFLNYKRTVKCLQQTLS